MRFLRPCRLPYATVLGSKHGSDVTVLSLCNRSIEWLGSSVVECSHGKRETLGSSPGRAGRFFQHPLCVVYVERHLRHSVPDKHIPSAHILKKKKKKVKGFHPRNYTKYSFCYGYRSFWILLTIKDTQIHIT